MRICAPIVLAIIFASNAFGQTNTFPAIGNVGIATLNPVDKLDVKGFIRSDGIRTDAMPTGAEMVYIRGTGLNHNGNRIVKIGPNTLVNQAGRGLCLTVISAETHALVSNNVYDVYTSYAVSDNLATALNNLTRDQIGILTSYDAYEYHINDSLRNVAQRLGLFKLAGIQTSGYLVRQPYAAIFRGSGTSTNHLGAARQAIEVLQSRGYYTPYAIISTWVIEDGFVSQGMTNALISANPDSIDPAVFVNYSSNVGIGTTRPQSKLAVNGTITAKEVKVTQSGWSDYVFDSTYNIPPLSLTEACITANHHLPGIPSAQEIANKGLDIGEMQKKQMQKIEELTLYVLDQQKQIYKQDKKVEEMNHQIDALKVELNKIRKILKK